VCKASNRRTRGQTLGTGEWQITNECKRPQAHITTTTSAKKQQHTAGALRSTHCDRALRSKQWNRSAQRHDSKPYSLVMMMITTVPPVQETGASGEHCDRSIETGVIMNMILISARQADDDAADDDDRHCAARPSRSANDGATRSSTRSCDNYDAPR
jgi:hypothetical protein